jgi:hypothetical protein
MSLTCFVLLVSPQPVIIVEADLAFAEELLDALLPPQRLI